MNIGDLRHRITIQGADSDGDMMGGSPQTFTDKFSCFSGVKVDSGEKDERAERFERNLTIKFKIRYRDDVSIYDRLVFDGQKFEIKDIYHDSLKTVLYIECEEVHK